MYPVLTSRSIRIQQASGKKLVPLPTSTYGLVSERGYIFGNILHVFAEKNSR